MAARQETCSFTGHRPEKLPWGYDESDPRCKALKFRLADAVEIACEQGFRHFICGMASGCDLYFCECVLELRDRHPEVTVEAAVPCPGQADGWPEDLQEHYYALLKRCDFQTMISNRRTRECMLRRDRYMVDHSSLLIAVFDGTSGGTRYTLEYALRQRVDIVDIQLT